MRAATAILVIAVLLSPTATASFEDVRTWERHIHHESDGDGIVTEFDYVSETPHGFSIPDRRSYWLVEATYTSRDPSTGTSTATISLEIDGVDICNWEVSRTAIVGLVQEVSHTFIIKCNNTTAVLDGTHTVEVKVTGTSPIVAATTSISIYQLDTITDDSVEKELLSAMNPIAASIALLFWLALIGLAFLVTLNTDWQVPRFLSIGLFIISIFVGLAELSQYGLGGIALLMGLLGIALASAKRNEIRTT